MTCVWVISVEDDFGFFTPFLGPFCWSIPWTHLYKLRRTHRRAVVAVVVAVAVAAVVVVAVVAAVAVVTAAARRREMRGAAAVPTWIF